MPSDTGAIRFLSLTMLIMLIGLIFLGYLPADLASRGGRPASARPSRLAGHSACVAIAKLRTLSPTVERHVEGTHGSG
jgi:hypothetical protein